MKRWFSTSRLELVLVLAAMVLMSAPAASAGRTNKPVSNTLGSKLQRILDDAVGSPKAVFPGTGLYVSQPERPERRGEANVHPRTPMHPNDTFRAGSIMKPFVATVAATGRGGSHHDPLTAAPGTTSRGLQTPTGSRCACFSTTRAASRSTTTPGSTTWFSSTRARKVDELLDPRPDGRGGSGQRPRTRTPTQPARPRHRAGDRSAVAQGGSGARHRSIGLTHTSLRSRVTSISDAAHGYELVNGKLRDVTDIDCRWRSRWQRARDDHRGLEPFLDALLAGKLFEKSTLPSMLIRTRTASRGFHWGTGWGSRPPLPSP